MKKLFLQSTLVLVVAAVFTSCLKDLDRQPTNDTTSQTALADFQGYQASIAKVYGAYALTGNAGPAGNGHVQGIDEGTSDFLRLYWWVQEITTDEAVVQVGWNDPGIHFFHSMNWSTDNVILKGLYYRSFYQINLANEFLRQSTDEKLNKRNNSSADQGKVRQIAQETPFPRGQQ